MRWSAPEVLNAARAPTAASDVWAFGMTLVEVFTGKRPFDDVRRDVQVSYAVAYHGLLPERPAEWATDRLWDAMLGCWHLEPEKRTSVSAVREVLAESRIWDSCRMREGAAREEAMMGREAAARSAVAVDLDSDAILSNVCC